MKEVGAVVDAATSEADGTQTIADGGDSEVVVEGNVTSDLDPFANAFAQQQQRNDEQDNTSHADKQQQVAADPSAQDGQNRDAFDMGSNGQNQGYNHVQPYGSLGQGQNWNQQGQQPQQPQQGGDHTSNWGQQLPSQQSDNNVERRDHSN